MANIIKIKLSLKSVEKKINVNDWDLVEITVSNCFLFPILKRKASIRVNRDKLKQLILIHTCK